MAANNLATPKNILSAKVCILSESEVAGLEDGVKPVCSHHRHCKREDADFWIWEGLAKHVPLPGPFRIVWCESAGIEWRKTYNRTGALTKGVPGMKGTYGPGQPTLQLVASGG